MVSSIIKHMAKKKLKQKKVSEKKELLNDADILAITSTMALDTVQLKGLRWQVKMTVRTTLPRSYRGYVVLLDLDEAPYLSRIKELEDEFDGTLFKEDPVEKKKHIERLKVQKDQLERLRNECEEIKFVAIVDELKYKENTTQLLMRVPDDVIEAFNRQKTRFEIYKVILTPITETQ